MLDSQQLEAVHRERVLRAADRWAAQRGGPRAGETEAERELYAEVVAWRAMREAARTARSEDDTRPLPRGGER